MHENIWRFADGTEAIVNGKFVDELVLPAQPGFEALFVHVNEAEIRQESFPVLGWRLAADDHNEMEFVPLVQNQENDPTNYVGAVYPDARVLWARRWFEDRAAFIEAIKADWIEQNKRKAERAAEAVCPTCGTRKVTDDDIPF